jgi:adenine-specific DNA-methyltransferase
LSSGSTAATAHKLKRQYIGIEQMNNIEDLAVKRLNNVINGDLKGISKKIDWKGGGSFIYCELAKNNYHYIDLINKAKNKTQLVDIWNNISKDQFISYKIDIQKFKEETSNFEDLVLDLQKQILLSCIDKNQLYINYSDSNDTKIQVINATACCCEKSRDPSFGPRAKTRVSAAKKNLHTFGLQNSKKYVAFNVVPKV